MFNYLKLIKKFFSKNIKIYVLVNEEIIFFPICSEYNNF